MTKETAKNIRENSIGWTVQRISAALSTDMADRLKPFGLTLQQFSILMTVLEHGESSQTEIGARFRAPAYAISRALDALEKQGLVERRPDPNSRRTHMVFATSKGVEITPAIFAVVKQANTDLVGPLDAKETAILKSLLTRVMEHQIS